MTDLELRDTLKPGTRVWLDVESTGTTDNDDILEVAAVVTDDDNIVLAETSYLITGGDYGKMNAFVMDMHTGSGLIADLENLDNCGYLDEVEDALASFISTYCEVEDPAKRATLCGSSIQFDQRMLRAHMPKVIEVLHYRIIDVTTLRRTIRDRTKGAVDFGKPACPHRALGDVHTSIQEHNELFEAYDAWVIEKHMAAAH